jgi:hypothetical protein
MSRENVGFAIPRTIEQAAAAVASLLSARKIVRI